MMLDLTPEQLVEKYSLKDDNEDREVQQHNLELNQLMRLTGMLEKREKENRGDQDEGIEMDTHDPAHRTATT